MKWKWYGLITKILAMVGCALLSPQALAEPRPIASFAAGEGLIRDFALCKEEQMCTVLTGDVFVVDIQTWKEVCRITDEWGIDHVAMSREKKSLALGNQNGNVVLYGIDGKKKRVLKAHKERVTGLTYLEGQGKLLSYSDDGTMRMWDIEKGEQEKIVYVRDDPGYRCLGLARSPQGRLVSCEIARGRNKSGLIYLWDVKEGKELRTLEYIGMAVVFAAISHDEKQVAASTLDEIILWEVPSGKQTAKHASGLDYVASLSFTPDGKRLVAGGYLRTGKEKSAAAIEIWDVVKGKVIAFWKLDGESIGKCQVITKGTRILAAVDNQLHLYKIPEEN